MPRQRVEASATTWQDIAECVPAWEEEAAVCVEATIRWQSHLKDSAYVEVVLRERPQAGSNAEVCRVRQPFPARKAAGQAGAVLHAIFLALRDYDSNPWLWTREKRARLNRGV